jgi:hypothetical protein
MEEARQFILTDDSVRVSTGLITIALGDPNRTEAHQIVSRYLAHRNKDIVAAALISLAHIARIDHFFDKSNIPLLRRHLADNQIMPGRVRDAIEDICHYANVDESQFFVEGHAGNESA